MGVYAQPPSAIQASIRPDEGIMVEKMNLWMIFGLYWWPLVPGPPAKWLISIQGVDKKATCVIHMRLICDYLFLPIGRWSSNNTISAVIHLLLDTSRLLMAVNRMHNLFRGVHVPLPRMNLPDNEFSTQASVFWVLILRNRKKWRFPQDIDPPWT